MLQIIFGQDLRVGTWVFEKTGGLYTKKDSTTIGLEKNGELVAGFVYNNYIPNRSIAMHVAGNLFTKKFIKAGFRYPFKQLKVLKTIAFIDSTNIKSVKFTSKLGAIHEATIKDAGRHGDLLIYTMTQEQFRFKD